jgi:hypothetical protein
MVVDCYGINNLFLCKLQVLLHCIAINITFVLMLASLAFLLSSSVSPTAIPIYRHINNNY